MAEQLIRQYGYRVDDRTTFEEKVLELMEDTEAPVLIERSRQFPGSHVLWDPEGGSEGFMLIGDDADALARDLVEQLELGEDPFEKAARAAGWTFLAAQDEHGNTFWHEDSERFEPHATWKELCEAEGIDPDELEGEEFEGSAVGAPGM